MADFSSELGHVQLEVVDLDRSVAFYRKFLGLTVTERVNSRKGRLAFLSGGDRHHDVALRAAPDGYVGRPAGSPGRDAPSTGFSAPFQIAFELDDRSSFADLLFLLRREGVPATALDHGTSWALYFRDPDGNALEAYLDVREDEGGRRRWGGESRLLAVDQILSEDRVRRLLEERRDGPAPPGRAETEEGAESSVPGTPEASGPGRAEDRSGTTD